MNTSIKMLMAMFSTVMLVGCAGGPTPPVPGGTGGIGGVTGDVVDAARGSNKSQSTEEAVAQEAGERAADEIAGSSDNPDPMDVLGEATGGAADAGAAIGAAQSLQGSAMGAAFSAMGGNSGVTAEEAQAMDQNIDASEPYERDGRTCIDYHIQADNVPGEDGSQEQSLTACETDDGDWEAI